MEVSQEDLIAADERRENLEYLEDQQSMVRLMANGDFQRMIVNKFIKDKGLEIALNFDGSDADARMLNSITDLNRHLVSFDS